MLATGGESRLDLKDAPVVSVGRWHGREGGQAIGQGVVVLAAPGGVPELEGNRPADGHPALYGEGREGGGDGRLRQPGEDGGIGEVPGPGHLGAAPRAVDAVEVEPSLLGEDRNQLEPASGMHDLPKRGVDRVAQRRRPEDGRGLACDIPVNINRCLRHARMICQCRGAGYGAAPYQPWMSATTWVAPALL